MRPFNLPVPMTRQFDDQMRGVTESSWDSVYHYDAAGQRVRKVVRAGSATTDRLYIGGWERVQTSTSSLQKERETLHVMDDQRRIAMIETLTLEGGSAVTITPRFRFQLGNHLESAALEVDEDGSIITYEEYHPYGTTSWWATDGGTEVSAKRYRYTGKERDDETGLQRHGVRGYIPWLGRWERPDPAGMVDGPNIYAYCRGNPVGCRDLTGMGETDATDAAAIEPEWTIFGADEGPQVLGALARGERAPETLDEASSALLVGLQKTASGLRKDEIGFAVFALDDGRIAVSPVLQGETLSGSSEGARVVWNDLYGDSPGEWKSPDSSATVVGALLVHVHPRNDKTPGTPSLASWEEHGLALAGDLAYLLGANRPGPSGQEVPLGVPSAIATIPSHGKGDTMSVISRASLTQQQSDQSFDVLKGRLQGQFVTEQGVAGLVTSKPVLPGFTLDRQYPDIEAIPRLLRLLEPAAPTSLTTTQLQPGSMVRTISFGR